MAFPVARLESFLDHSVKYAVDPPAYDPLRHDGAMDEAVLVDVRFDAVHSVLWLLVDTRGAIEQVDGNVAAFAFERATEFSWLDERDVSTRRAAVILEWKIRSVAGGLELVVGTTPWATLRVRSRRAEFYLGLMPSIRDVPDFVEADDSTIKLHQPNWDSDFQLMNASSREG